MGVSSRPSTAEVTQQQEQKPRIGRKRGVSRAQRDRWQLGTPTQSNPDSQRGPTGRSSFEADSMSGAVMRQQNADSMQVRIQPSRVDTAASDQPQRPAASGTAGSPSQSTKSDARAPGGAPPANRGDFGSTGDMAKLEQNISPFRKIQDHHASGSGRGEVAAHADGTTAAATTVRTDSVESESSNDSPRSPGWRFRRARVQPTADRRAASIALEREGLAQERKERAGAPESHRHLHTTKGRVENVELDPEAGGIWVPGAWAAKEGTSLTDDLVLGKVLGAGFQAHVYELKDREGRTAPVVIKATRKGALIANTRREWAVGQRLVALGPGDSPLPGFMKVGPAVCRERKREGKGAQLSGMILERINGKSVDKIVMDKEFHDIYYIRDMLLEVFTALDAAQRAFGFHHYDLRLDNVMEHRPDRSQNATDRVSMSMVGSAEERSEERMWKIIDFGLAKFDEMYAADEGADTNLDISEPKSSAFYTAPFRLLKWAPEAVHQAAWHGKGDVYHLLFDLSQKMHGRVWPERDRATVKRCISLIQHVCGVKPSASFYNEAGMESGAPVQCLPVQCFGVPVRDRSGFRGAKRQFVHRSYVLKPLLQLKAWQFPTNPGLTAGEVLTAPFFRE